MGQYNFYFFTFAVFWLFIYASLQEIPQTCEKKVLYKMYPPQKFVI